MRRLSRIEEECKRYMTGIQRMHQQLQEQRENEVSFFFCLKDRKSQKTVAGCRAPFSVACQK